MRVACRRCVGLVVACFLLVLAAGCPSGVESDDRQQAVDAGDVAGADVEDEEAAFAPIGFDDLDPEVWTKGPGKVTPSAVIVEFGRDIRTEAGELGDDHDIALEPEIEGTWRAEGTDRLVFRPDSPFQPGQAYDVVIGAVEVQRHDATSGTTIEETLAPESPWTHTIEVPEFAFLELLTPVAKENAGEIDVDVRFSAPPASADLSDSASWSVEGEPHSEVSYERGSRDNIVRATLEGLDLEPDNPKIPVSLALTAGVPFDDETTAPAAEAETEAHFGPSVEIRELFVQEGGNGHYIHVVCHDNAVADKEYFRDVKDYDDYEVSERCVPDIESAREYIQIEPEVDFSVSPAPAGFQLHGDFQRETFDIEVKPGLQTIDGGVVEELTTESLEIGPRSPQTQVAGAGRYLPTEAWNQLPVRHRNVDALRVEVRHVPRENLVFWLSDYSDDANERNSNRIAESRIAVQEKPDESTTSYVDLSKVVDERQQGVHQITVQGLERREPDEREAGENKFRNVEQDTARYVATDINLVAKRHAAGPDDAWSRTIDVWALNMKTGEPMDAVAIETVRKSGYTLGECATDSTGHCRLEVDPKKTDPAEPFALIAEGRGQVTFLEYSDLETDPQVGDVTGSPYLIEEPYRVSMYGDRDLYRPAETVHVAGVVRTDGLGSVQESLPVELTLTDSRGNEVRTRLVETNDIGAFEFSHELGDLAATGRWSLEARIGDQKIETYDFLVEEFVPERMRVEADPTDEHILAGGQAGFDVKARYLFGASAEGSEVKLECQMQPQVYVPDRLASYQFGPAPFEDEDRESSSLESTGATIGEDDRAEVGCQTNGLTGAMSAKVQGTVSVLEAGSGRSTDEQASTWVHPERYGIGLKTGVDEVEQGETFTVEGVVADWTGEPVEDVDQVAVDIIALDRTYGRYYHHGRGYDWTYDWRQYVTGKRSVAVDDGKFEFEINAQQPRDAYAVRVRAGDATSTLQVDVDRYSYHWGYGSGLQVPDPNAAPLEVSGPVEVGESSKVTLDSPFAGRALVTVETHQVVEYEWIEVEAGENEWSFDLDEFVPNAYVTALVVKDPQSESDGSFVPKRAFGVQSVEVVPERYDGTVSLDAPDKVRPSEVLEVGVEADVGSGPAYATVAVVDEGILQLTDYQSPDPLETLLEKRGLGVDTFDTIAWNVEHPSLGDPTGGGAARPGGQKKAGRSMPVEPVALWSGLVKLEDGSAQIPFQMPEFRGEVRVMGVAMSQGRIAADSTSTKVRDPLGLQATTPRFLSAEDRVEVPTMVTNQTGGEKTIEVRAAARSLPVTGYETPFDRSEPIDFEGDATRTVTLADGESTNVRFPARATARSGAAGITITATAEGHESQTSSTVPLQPSAPTERKVQTKPLESGTMDLTGMLEGWVPRSERTSIRISSIPFSDVIDKVDGLIEYPYGCLEQTVSSTRPLIFLPTLAESVDPSLLEKHDNLDEMVQHGVDRVLSMQLSSGAFGYWPSNYSPHSWTSAYATGMLLDAREAGFDVPESRLDRALEWLGDAVRQSKYDDAHPMAHYVLARAGEADRAAIRQSINERLSENDDPSGVDRERLYLLKAALYEAGDRTYESELKNLGTLMEASNAEDAYGGDFYSSIRELGMAMSIKIDLFGPEAIQEPTIQALVDKVRDEWHLNTQEATWTITTLGKWVDGKSVDSELGDVELRIDGRAIEPSHRSEHGEPTWNVAHAADRGRIELESDVNEDSSWYVTVRSEGVRENPTVEFGDHGLVVERDYLDADGNSIDLSSLEVGDLFYVRLSVEATTGEEVDNVAIVDRLPAGLEIENPRLSGTPEVHEKLVNDASYRGSPFRDGEWWYDHMNVRDDRLQVFGDLPDYESRQVVYGVRATLAGEFHQPPLEAHAMYLPSVRSLKAGETVTIGGRE
jgi:uncharacterized protein YfaS (alpha-2-macroglobulin family)